MLALSSVIASEIESRNSIPERFHGNWAPHADNCNKSHIQNLWIGPTSLEFYESTGIAISIAVKNQRELALIVDFSGEGYEWIGFVHFRISKDGDLLTDIESPNLENQIKRVKC